MGAVVVKDDQVIGRGCNRKEQLTDPTAHAEILALRQAGETLGSWRLNGATLFCTLEPCSMCAGAMVNARLDRLVFALRDPKTGAAGSVYDLVRSPWLNHRLQITAGVLEDEVKEIMDAFFASLRRDPAEGCQSGRMGRSRKPL